MVDHVALIGDVVASRDLPSSQRKHLQGRLRAWLEALNDRLASTLSAPLTLTAGDEIQGLFRKPSVLVEVVQDLTDRMFQLDYTASAVFGAGRGELTTGVPRRDANPALLDGPAFHLARAALEKAQHEGRWVCFEGFGRAQVDHEYDHVNDVVLDALFALMQTIRERWTAKQGEFAWKMRAIEARAESQKDLAKRAQVSPSVISEALKAARYSSLTEGERAARALLETLDARR